MQIVRSKLKTNNVYFNVFSGVSSAGSWLCSQKKFGINLALVSVSAWCAPILPNPKEHPFCFIKSSSSQFLILFIGKRI